MDTENALESGLQCTPENAEYLDPNEDSDGLVCDPPGTVRFALGTITSTRKTLGRLMRLRMADRIDSAKYRDVLYGFSILNQAWKLSVAEDFEKRLVALEQALNLKEVPR